MANTLLNTCCNTCSTTTQPDRRQETGDRRHKPSTLLPCVTYPPFVYAFVALIARQVQTVSRVGEST